MLDERKTPTLYLLLRRDLPDMNPGKSIAQGSHATDDFSAWRKMITSQPDHYSELIAEFDRWKEDRNFGTVLVLEATLAEMQEVVCTNDFAGLTIDPTYPWRNHYGDVFLTEEITAAWCFICDQTEPTEVLQSLNLHR